MMAALRAVAAVVFAACGSATAAALGKTATVPSSDSKIITVNNLLICFDILTVSLL
jgi:hypothetical protein